MTITNRVSFKSVEFGITSIDDVVDAPTIGTATAGVESATVTYTAAATGGAATTFTAISTPGSITGSSATSPITVSGLTGGTAYTFKVYGANASGTWSAVQSAASNSVTPTVGTSFDSIATVTVGSGGASSVTFSSIPQTYTHLQIRGVAATDKSGQVVDSIAIRYNSDSGSNYYAHNLQGGYTTTARVDSGSSGGYLSYEYLDSNGTAASSVFTGYIIDILDYKNTNKLKVIRSLHGFDCNGTTGTGSLGGSINLHSGLWNNTNAISSITIYGDNRTPSNLVQYTTFSLYGIKSA